jgi:N-acyl-D-aspartate/D-glutamate deacylase
MAEVARLPHAIDFALQMTHDPLRVFVMGERGLAREAATAEDIDAMARLLRRGSRRARSVSRRGAPTTTARCAARRRRRARRRAPSSAGWRAPSRGWGTASCRRSPTSTSSAAGAVRRGVRHPRGDGRGAAGHTLSISLSQRDAAPDQWRRILGRVEAATRRGLSMRVQVAPRAIGVLLGLEATFHPFIGFPSYKRIAHLPLAERVRILREGEFKRVLLAERSDPVAGDGSPIPPLADRLLADVDRLAFRLFRLGERPDYEPPMSASLGAWARAHGRRALDVVYDAMLEDDGHELLYFPIFNYTAGNLGPVREMLGHPLALPGLSDGGAHVGTVCDASFPSYYLLHWTRDRAEGRLPLSRVVQMLTSDGARHVGLGDRGRIAPGLRADLNVIDVAKLALERPRLHADLPGGSKRLLQRARGYRATLVAGRTVILDDELTGERPGTLARPGSSM